MIGLPSKFVRKRAVCRDTTLSFSNFLVCLLLALAEKAVCLLLALPEETVCLLLARAEKTGETVCF